MTFTGTPITTDPTYAEYVALGGSAPEDDYPRLLALAKRRLAAVTQNRDLTDHLEAVHAAMTEAINVLSEIGGFTSESLGSYSYTKPGKSDGDVNAAIIAALAGTGLTYRGIAWNTAQSPL